MEEATDKQLRVDLITTFMNLQRIKHAEDPDKEIEYQLKEVRLKLQALGIDANHLEAL